MTKQPQPEETAEVQPNISDKLVQQPTVEDHCKKLGTELWLFNAARAYHRWAIGKECSEQQYKDALQMVLNERYGY